jgi:hypothetical protein
LKLVCSVNIVHGNLKLENSQDYACPETSIKLYIHEFGFSIYDIQQKIALTH